MAPDAASKAPSAGLSLYANLLDSTSNTDTAPGTISRAPVVFKQLSGEEARQDTPIAEKQQISAASLRFQPTKRPQLSTQKPKPKATVSRAPQPSNTTIRDLSPNEASNPTIRPSAKTTLADWTADGEDDDVNGSFRGEKRQRGGRKKRRKNKEESHVPQNWDDIYDPSRPNNYEDYKHSDEKLAEIREWKDRLYAHRMARRHSSDSDSASEARYRPQMNRQLPPPGLSFAPPPIFDDLPQTRMDNHPTSVPDDPTGKDAHGRRMRLSQLPNPQDPPGQSSNAPDTMPSPPPLQPRPKPNSSHSAESRPPPATKIPAQSSILRAPVRYNLPPAPSDIPASEAELETALQTEQQEEEEPASDAAPRSLRPGQKGFAERLMSKYGWSKGSGLGASGSGIVNPLRVQVEKQKKKPDSEGGGFVGPGGMGKIVGGKKKGGAAGAVEEGKFGAMSEVVVLRGMVNGMDLDAELEGAGDGGLMQEIGEECGEKYGRVERVFIDRSNHSQAPVFIKFISQLSALRAVNALEGRIFNGNIIAAKFFDSENFEAGKFS